MFVQFIHLYVRSWNIYWARSCPGAGYTVIIYESDSLGSWKVIFSAEFGASWPPPWPCIIQVELIPHLGFKSRGDISWPQVWGTLYCRVYFRPVSQDFTLPLLLSKETMSFCLVLLPYHLQFYTSSSKLGFISSCLTGVETNMLCTTFENTGIVS